MDYAFSPHQSAGGTLHLPSPTHPHSYRENFNALHNLRRSLSRSPSRHQQLSIFEAKTPSGSPRSPLAPVLTTKGFTPPSASSSLSSAASAVSAASASPVAGYTVSSAVKKKFTLRRTAGFRSSPRINATTRSPMRRALSETSNGGNITPSASRRSSQEEQQQQQLLLDGDRNRSIRHTAVKSPMPNLDSGAGPIRFEFGQGKENRFPLGINLDLPAKSSPLKRDVEMNRGDGQSGSPNPKRRSIHSAIFGSETDFFSQATSQADSENNPVMYEANAFSPLAVKRMTDSPVRRPQSLRKSTLQQRQSLHVARPKFTTDPAMDVENSPASPSAITQGRQRSALDGLDFGRDFNPAATPTPTPINRPNHMSTAYPLFPGRQVAHRPSLFTSHPHPLSQTLSPSSGSNLASHRSSGNSSHQPDRHARIGRSNFTRSLPIGATRPHVNLQTTHASDAGSFATPESYKAARPLPTAFMSTGLISKRNRNVDFPNDDEYATYAMPDTPSKRASFPPVSATPFTKSGPRPRAQPEFGKPGIPFGVPIDQTSPIPFGKTSNIFGSSFNAREPARRGSLVARELEENADSPMVERQDSQSSADELPPTPTKPAGKPKESSLRSSLFGRRVSLGPDTFLPPGQGEATSPVGTRKGKLAARPSSEPSPPFAQPTFVISTAETVAPSPVSFGLAHSPFVPQRSNAPSNDGRFSNGSETANATISSGEAHHLRAVSATPVAQAGAGRLSPHTPSESFTPPDPSSLSISGGNKFVTSLKDSLGSTAAFPPATPTAPREAVFPFGPTVVPVVGVTQNDVDTSLTSRFSSVTTYGIGEFSVVYKVVKPSFSNLSFTSPATVSSTSVWAVKKSKKAYAGQRDRERKLREVAVLRALRGNDHIINYVDSWEANHHLYIQTEFCEDGNLKDFLARTGNKGRLDDFRIWKILSELSLGIKFIHDSGYIHLDLKPANVFIDFEGVLKIGDFGLASSWPASPLIEGEGDREYIGPEVLHGQFDKPADVFALGMILLEIAGNCILPDNGTSWQKLRQGDISDLPSLTWSSESSLARNDSGEPILRSLNEQSFLNSDDEATPLITRRAGELVSPPNFMIDANDREALDNVVQWMICPRPEDRPTIDQVHMCEGVQWVQRRRRSGATIYEGNWGPSDDVLGEQDVDMMDV